MFASRLFKVNRKLFAVSLLAFGVTIVIQVIAGLCSTIMWFFSLLGSPAATDYYSVIQVWMTDVDALYDIMLYSFVAVLVFALIERALTAHEKKLAAHVKDSSD